MYRNEVAYTDRLILNGLQYLFYIGVFLCLIIMVRSWLQWSSANKDKEKRARAKRRILWSLVGLIATFVTYFILSVFLAMLGVGLVLY
jgi:hypothetical protein